MATEAWLVLHAGSRAQLVEPGPSMRVASEVSLLSQEVPLDLSPVDAERPRWQMLTNRRRLELASGAAWSEVERFADSAGALVWVSGRLSAFYRRDRGTTVFEPGSGTPLLTDPGYLKRPVWTSDGSIVCQGRDLLYLGSPSHLSRLSLPETMTDYPPVLSPGSSEALLSGVKNVWRCDPQGRSCLKLCPGGGALVAAPVGFAIVETDRFRICAADGRSLWDSQTTLPSFRTNPGAYDLAGTTLLIPQSTTGARTTLTLFDLHVPGRYWKTAIDGRLLADPCLLPGGIAIASPNAGGAAEIAWIGVAR